MLSLSKVLGAIFIAATLVGCGGASDGVAADTSAAAAGSQTESAQALSVNYAANAVTVQVTGAGMIANGVNGVQGPMNCGNGGTICSVSYPRYTSVMLGAVPASGMKFLGWGGACSGTNITCTVNNSQARNVTASFGSGTTTPPAPTNYTLSVSTSSGGSVSSSPAGISCGGSGSACSGSFASGTMVSLNPVPASGYAFSGWSGACSGTGACSLAMTTSRSVVGSFQATTTTPPVSNALQVHVVGSGSVSSSPAGISCVADCTASFASTSSVTLSATPASGSVFGGWSGATCSGTGTCTVNMSAAANVTASFTTSSTTPPTGKSYFVATTGSDSNAGTSISAPLKTINKAATLVNAGDVIEVRAGTYTESVVIRRPGSAAAWITLRGYNGERPVIKSASAGPTVYFYNSLCDEDTVGNGSGNTDCLAMYWVVQGLEIQGSPNGGGDGNAIKIDTPKVKLIGNRLCCSVADVVKLVRTSNDVEVLNNEIWQDASVVQMSTNAQGVDIVGADRVRVAGNYVHDVPNIGIYAKGNARNTIFENNRLVNIGDANNGHALMLGQDTDSYRLVDGTYETYDGIVRNNVVVGATWACLATSSSSNARFYNNSCYDTGKLMHGSILISNESEVGQTGAGIYFGNNIIYGSSARPVFKIASNAMTDYKTLVLDHNVYYVNGGNPTFVASDYFSSPISFTQWLTQYKSLSGRDDVGSKVVDPKFSTTTGATPLTLSSGSPAIDAGVNLSLVPTDIRGIKRAQGASTDIGAYEY